MDNELRAGALLSELNIHISCIPPKATSANSRRIFKVGGKTILAKSKAAMEATGDLLSLLKPYQPNQPFEGAVHLVLEFQWPYRASEPKKNRNAPIWHCSRPDCDNIAKLVTDCMTKLAFWNDDSQVASLLVSKQWGNSPGIGIRIVKLG